MSPSSITRAIATSRGLGGLDVTGCDDDDDDDDDGEGGRLQSYSEVK